MENRWRRSKWEWALDIAHLCILVILLIYTFRAVICVDMGFYYGNFFYDLKQACLKAGVTEIFTFIGAVAFILFGIVGIYDFCYSAGLGLRVLVPPTFVHMKEKTYAKQAEEMMRLYYEKDIDFIREYEKERVDYVLQAAGIDEAQFRHIRYELVKARAMPIKGLKELRRKAESIVYDRKFIVDQTGYELCERVYKEVDYFINLYTALYDPKLCADVGHIMANYIVMCMGKKVNDLDYIIIPHGSNLLLGLEVGKILRKPVISIQEKARIHRHEFWDGTYLKKDSGTNRIIIIHDVLVSGRRIYESIEKLPYHTYEVEGLYCLIKYKNKQFCPEKELKQYHIDPINCLLCTDERTLQGIYEKKGKEVG